MNNMNIRIMQRKILNMTESELAVYDPVVQQKRDTGFADSRLKDMMKVFTTLCKTKR